MRYWPILAVVLVLASCASEGERVQGGNGLVDPLNTKLVAQAILTVDPKLWHKVLIVRYRAGWTVYEDHWCIFKSAYGNLYAYNKNGSRSLIGSGQDPSEVADQLYGKIISATYQ